MSKVAARVTRSAKTPVAWSPPTHRIRVRTGAETKAKMNEAKQRPAAKSRCRYTESQRCSRLHTLRHSRARARKDKIRGMPWDGRQSIEALGAQRPARGIAADTSQVP